MTLSAEMSGSERAGDLVKVCNRGSVRSGVPARFGECPASVRGCGLDLLPLPLGLDRHRRGQRHAGLDGARGAVRAVVLHAAAAAGGAWGALR